MKPCCAICKIAHAVLIASSSINPKKTNRCSRAVKTPTVADLPNSPIKEVCISTPTPYIKPYGGHLYTTAHQKSHRLITIFIQFIQPLVYRRITYTQVLLLSFARKQ